VGIRLTIPLFAPELLIKNGSNRFNAAEILSNMTGPAANLAKMQAHYLKQVLQRAARTFANFRCDKIC
jgi:hypothetical protein